MIQPLILFFALFPLLPPAACPLAISPLISASTRWGQGQEQGVTLVKACWERGQRNGRHKVFRLSVASIYPGSPQTLSSEIIWCSHDHEICLLFIIHSYTKCDFRSKIRRLFQDGVGRKMSFLYLLGLDEWLQSRCGLASLCPLFKSRRIVPSLLLH